ncbi:MAG TPA: MBL fold metallo-hydrolase [Blastocatellia bacterium]|nr:MBL fold metallo-hydrolase [Blastocatellia bacterium]
MEWNVITLMEGHLLGASSILVTHSSQAIVIDTGMANQRNSLLNALKQNGLDAGDVSLVLNTHMHVDHSNNNCVFHNARIITSRRNFEWTLALQDRLDTMNEHNLDEIMEFYPDIHSIDFTPKIATKFIKMERTLWKTENIGAVDRYDWLETSKLPEGITAVPTPGHVPDHVSFVIDGTDHQVLIAGDALIVRGGDESKVLTFPPQQRDLFESNRDWVSTFAGEIIPGHDARFLNLPIEDQMPLSALS